MVFGGGCHTGGDVHWEYSGDKGPEHWGTLDKSFEMCSKGKNQSPINLTDFIEADLKPLKFNTAAFAREILNNGHTVQVNFEKGSKLTVDTIDFTLLQCHFHAPSEHHMNGKSYAMEAHLVHADDMGNLAVVAVMFEPGSVNPWLETLWKQMPKEQGERHSLSEGSTVRGILPNDRDYYRYNGSLTTPPGTEGVRWLVMKTTMTASEEQIKMFEQVMHHPNNRPIQPTNARMVLK
ncbi:MAG: carbonic anhydrase family protein [Phycisphaerae bacterium]|nr:carbonic anhydrase family protein [Phycisphaerae bacterium]